MKGMPKVPWDLAVFLTITTVGFGFSIRRLVNQDVKTQFRLPASEAEADIAFEQKGANHSSFDLGCLDQKPEKEQLNSDQSRIRLRGKFCRLSRKAMKNFDGVRIKNLTNGYEGTIFFHGYDSSFVTDEVILEPGRNLIQLEWRASAESRPQTFTAEVLEQ